MRSKSTLPKSNKAAEAPPDTDGFSLISSGKLLDIYAAMLKCRMIAECAGSLMQKGRLAGNFHAGLGREASIAAMAVDLLPEDTLSPSPYDYLSCYIKGLPLHGMFSCLAVPSNGRKSSLKKPAFAAQANVIPPSSTSGAQLSIAIACGVALAHKTAKNGKIAVVSCGNGATSIASWYEAFSFAGERELPVLFVHHNDADDEKDPLAAHPRADAVTTVAPVCGVPAITVDGNDAVAVYRVASESIGRARLGRGPTLIECRACRLPDCSTTGNHPAASNQTHDPILRMESYLLGKGLFNAPMKRKITAAFARDLDAATRFINN